MLRQRIEPDRTPLSRTMALKVPEVTLYFWIVKLLTTAMGESTTDYLASAAVFAVLFALPGLAYWRLHLNPIVACVAYLTVVRVDVRPDSS